MLRLPNREAKYFSTEDWTAEEQPKSTSSPSGKSVRRNLGDVAPATAPPAYRADYRSVIGLRATSWLIRPTGYGVSAVADTWPLRLDTQMFVSFFPRPKLFFPSAIIWTALAMTFWYGYADDLIGSSEPGIVGVALFWSARSLWFDLYFALSVAIFAGGWMVFAPHPWAPWSIIGSALILFTSYFQVQVSVAINSWYGPFYDLVQAALSKSKPVTIEEFYSELSTFAGIALVAVVVGVLTRFFVSHYIFRWRTAMNDFYIANWPRLRTIEGASQRVQEDTMRFATTMEGLGVNLISSVLTLLAFLPVLLRLSSNVTELPLIGSIPYPLVFAAVIWSVVGTGALALIGIRLPGIEFFNQRVEAAYRKELVLGEDDPARADPPTLASCLPTFAGTTSGST